MNPIGIALAFLVFWSLVAVGSFLVITSGLRLRTRTRQIAAGGASAHFTAADGVAVAVTLAGLLLGAALIATGGYATYVVVLGI